MSETRPPTAAAGDSPSRPVTASCGDAVRVAVRCRPLLAHERAARAREAVRPGGDGRTLVAGADRLFQFDVVFGTAASQSDVYDECVAPLVESCFAGACQAHSTCVLSACR